MEENNRLSMKRKDIDRVNNDFSDFSLSSPARKIRRLDVDLPPIMEEEEIDLPMQETEIEVPPPVNEERSIVLFKPLHQPSSSTNLFVDRNLISGFKNRFFRDASIADDNHNYEDETSNECQAVVCWNPSSQSSYSQSTGSFKQPRTLEITELDETGEDVVMDEATNEIDIVDGGSNCLAFTHQQPQEEPAYGFGLHQWQQQQQQNCMIPQIPQVSTTPTPITWFR